MSDEPKKRGRPPRVINELAETYLPESSVDDEAVVENPISANADSHLEQECGETTIVEGVSATPVTILALDESPVEEKIHHLVEQSSHVSEIFSDPNDAIEYLHNTPCPVDGWENNMRIAPTDGRRIMVSKTGVGQGSLVYWRISKIVDKKNLRYVPKGRWTDFLSKKDIEFVPSYWKAYNPEEYWPLQG